MTSTAVLALVVVLNSAGGSIEITAAVLPESDCLRQQEALWSIPADSVVDDVPAVDAYCVDPSEAPGIRELRQVTP